MFNFKKAGADIAEMAPKDYSECHKQNFLANWADISKIRKPIIAAVNGYAVSKFILYDYLIL